MKCLKSNEGKNIYVWKNEKKVIRHILLFAIVVVVVTETSMVKIFAEAFGKTWAAVFVVAEICMVKDLLWGQVKSESI